MANSEYCSSSGFGACATPPVARGRNIRGLTPPARRLYGILLFLTAMSASFVARADETSVPWDVANLKQPPKVIWVDESGPLRKLYYESEPRNGKPTKVFAYCAFPEKLEGKAPAVVLIHGGGGKAFPEWAKLWADRGYIALAMDLAGKGADGQPLPDGGPDQSEPFKLPKDRTDLKEMWTYHAVAAGVRANSLLASLPQVDADRIGVTGISWGGYLTCIVAGVDDRFKYAVPVYGCGFLAEDSAWLKQFAAMSDDWRAEWLKNFDPSSHVGRAKMPVLFVNGTNDFAYPMGSYQKTYRLVENRALCVTVNMPHGHSQGWAPIEIGLFADQYVRGGKPLAKVDPRLKLNDQSTEATAKFAGADEPRAAFHWTTDIGPWQMRKWQSRDAAISGDQIKSEIPKERPLVFFVTLKDQRGATVSTEHEELK
jgi:cephalosporin-C deacetylase-like acetyl esterase